MSFIAKNPLIIPKTKSYPSAPNTDTRGLFAYQDGWYDIDDKGNINKILTDDDVLVGEKTEENGEIFNDYENNLATGLMSHVEGHQNHALSGVVLRDVTEYLKSNPTPFKDDFIAFKQPYIDQFYDGSGIGIILGFRITNADANTRLHVDVVKILRTTLTDDNYLFKIETPIDELNLGTLSDEFSIQAIFNYNGKVADYAHIEGWGNIVIGRTGHAEGYDTQVIENYGHSEGAHTIAGYGAHVEGLYSKALGRGSHAEGESVVAEGRGSHAEGYGSKAIGEGSHTEGRQTQAIGVHSHAEGFGTIAEKDSSHAEGSNTHANGNESHAEGYDTEANGDYSHSEGHGTKANGEKSHAEGFNTEANELYAHAEGSGTRANGIGSHSEGAITYANGKYSHAEGLGTIASKDSSHVQGQYNIEDTEQKYLHIVGNGTSAKRSNAHTLDKDGNAWFAGNITVGADNKELATKEDMPSKTSELTNDSGFITEEALPTKTSQLENDNFYITENQFNQQNFQFAQSINNLEQQFTGVYSELSSAQDRITDASNDAYLAMEIALGRAYACSFNNYEELINWFNFNDRPNVIPPLGECQIGQNIYIVTLNVPDLWISSVEDERVTYTYTTDEAFINELNTNGFVRVGKFKFSALETQKVDLTEYATKEEVGDIETALDSIIAIQNELIGGDGV